MVVFYILKCVGRYNVFVKEADGTFYLLRSCLTLEGAYSVIYYNMTSDNETYRIIQKFIIK